MSSSSANILSQPEDALPDLADSSSYSKTSTSISLIIAAARQHRYGRHAGEHWLRFSLDAQQYSDLQRQLQKDSSLLEHIRHDYFPSAKLFVLRMPGFLHEILISSVTQEILCQLRTIAESGSPSAKFAGDVKSNGSAELSFEDIEYGPHEPDASFRHSKAQFPSVILELSYSQKRKDLSRLADAYILGSDANIRVVIGIDVEYEGSKRASVSMWRPQIKANDMGEKELIAMQTITDQLFRDDVGNLVPDPQASLQLRLEDFGPEAFGANLPDLTQSIHISAETLFTFLEGTEANARRLKQGEGVKSLVAKSWVRKRQRDKTPPEHLGPDREAIFAE